MALVAGTKGGLFASDDFFLVTDDSVRANLVFVGYLCSDLAITLYFRECWPGYEAMLLHHVMAVLAWYVMIQGKFGHAFTLVGLLSEATTPFVNQRWFFDKCDMKSGLLYLVNGILITLLWFLIRVCLFGWMGWRIYEMRASVFSLSPYQIFVVLLAYFVGYALQIFWFRKILRGVLKALFKANSREPKESKAA
mmetsp:Transcript_42948/g.97151  ORF Transcript_42948/g.97151 Transcript_42948/m.97151 type:complete len:194 (-) Transcript_42948:206-787(-)